MQKFEGNVVGKMVLDFGAEWCGPCRRLEPILLKLEEEFPSITFNTVDVDESPETSAQYKVRSVPTLLFLVDGQEVDRIVGLNPVAALRARLRDLVEKL